MKLRIFVPLLLLIFAPACSLPSRSYHVHAANRCTATLSVGLVKNGPPLEDGWYAPADVAIGAPQLTDRHWGTIVEPGAVLILGPQSGHFADGVQAILRVYAGNPTIEELLAFGRDDPDRVDVYLWPGKSSYVIDRRGGRLTATRSEDYAAPAGPPAAPAAKER
jgi:hypothetical protein